MFTSKQLAELSNLEYLLYNYIITNAEKVIYMRVRDLASLTHVSATTIMRFCKKLDCDGFPEFKVKLKLYLEKTKTPNLTSAQNALTEFMERMLKTDYNDQIRKSAEFISKRKNVLFIGTGSSGILAEYGARYFSSLKKFSLHIKDPFFPLNGQFLSDSVTVALSVSGETENILSQVNSLKENGSTIISITNNSHCTLASISDFNLPYYVTSEFVGLANVTTQIPVVFLLESLAKELFAIIESSSENELNIGARESL
ncbi:SIS domain-containing protein [Bacillus mangrovi]|uniref:SIS domain-containing protein n=1 Tax=Metabacillus mangrovi TaxID=1491830 RepID=A0A7X2S6W8_9BACI|nr:MurR/RpiR family transcriptional regulator [Metabacillus mangrovi]MTH54385.1 SIS domain-containing protein [Metabacillus mangrovi]